jgi:hypothetical protein
MSDPIPQPDEDFDNLMNLFVPYAAGHAVALGIPAGMATGLTGALDLWNDAFPAHKTAQTAAQTATTIKNTTRSDLTARARPAIQIIQNNPAVSDDVRVEMGLPILDKTPTRPAVPTTRPVAIVDTRQRLQHVISWRDETTVKGKAKPPGVRGAQIWHFVGPTPPGDPGEFEFVALDTATPYLLEYEAADAGKLASYLLRWENTRGEFGPWSETVSATIPA